VGTREGYLEAGADAFVAKPVERAGLEAVLAELLRESDEHRERRTA
jgi:DNA-binding response OmpR family regulator